MSVVDTFVTESASFLKRHPGLDDVQKSFGGLTWGLMRAVAECPNCPGHYRVPITADGQIDHSGAWDRLACSHCRHVWTLAPVEPGLAPKKRRKARPTAHQTALRARGEGRLSDSSLRAREAVDSAGEGG